MTTTIFSKVIDSKNLFIIQFNRNQTIDSPYGNGPMNKMGILNSEGYTEVKMNMPPGIHTKLNSLDFNEAMEASLSNIERVEAIYAENRRVEKEKENARYQEKMEYQMKESRKNGRGWYSVELRTLVMKTRGNDGWITQSVRVLADSGYDAYHKAVEFVKNPQNFPSNVMLVQHVEDFETSNFEYIGVLTDENANY